MSRLLEGLASTAPGILAGLVWWSLAAAALLATVWLVAGLLPRRDSGLRASLWLAALLLVPVIPVAWRVVPLSLLSVEAPTEWTAEPSIEQGTATHAVQATGPAAPADASEQQAPAQSARRQGSPGRARSAAQVLAIIMLAAWAAGTLVMLARLVVAGRWLRRVWREAADVSDPGLLECALTLRRKLGLGRPVDLRVSSDVGTPVTIGPVWAVVIFPDELIGAGDRRLIEHALCHELAHVKRWDAVIALYRRLLEAALFFHPLVRLAGRRHALAQEHVCDDWAVSVLQSRTDYARSLADLAELAVRGPRVPALSLAHRPSVIRDRVTRLVEGSGMAEPRLGLRGVVTVAALSVALMLLASSVRLTRGAVEAAPAGGIVPAVLPALAPPREAQPEPVVLKHDDGSMDGKMSLGASGHFVQFQCPPGKWYLTEVQVFGSRYGSVQPPSDQFTITLCDTKFKTVRYIRKPYSIFAERGKWRGYSVPVPPLELPEARVAGDKVEPVPFWINVAFNPSSTKGVYVAYDDSDAECFSKQGLPDQTPEDMSQKYDWMVRLVVTQPPPEKVPPSLGEWLEPRKPLTPWQDAGLTEIKNDDGESDGKLSMSGSGPAVRFGGVPDGAELTRLRMYASRYGSGFDPETTFADYYVFDDEGRLFQTGRIPYALFTYEAQWVDVPLKPVKVPAAFWVLINPNAHQYKGVYTHYDTDVQATHSKQGRIPEELSDLREKWDWMIRAYVKTGQQ